MPAKDLVEFKPYWYDSSLLHSNFQSWQMRSLPTLDPYVCLEVRKLSTPRNKLKLVQIECCGHWSEKIVRTNRICTDRVSCKSRDCCNRSDNLDRKHRTEKINSRGFENPKSNFSLKKNVFYKTFSLFLLWKNKW